MSCTCTYLCSNYHVMYFQGTELVWNTTLVGTGAFGRYGHAVTSLGDLNDDGFDG